MLIYSRTTEGCSQASVRYSWVWKKYEIYTESKTLKAFLRKNQDSLQMFLVIFDNSNLHVLKNFVLIKEKRVEWSYGNNACSITSYYNLPFAILLKELHQPRNLYVFISFEFQIHLNLSLYNLITRWLSSAFNLILNLLQVSLRMATKERLRYIKNGEELEAPTWSWYKWRQDTLNIWWRMAGWVTHPGMQVKGSGLKDHDQDQNRTLCKCLWTDGLYNKQNGTA